MFEKGSMLAFFGILIHCLDQYWHFISLLGYRLDSTLAGSNLYPKCRKGKHTGILINCLYQYWQFINCLDPYQVG